MTTSVRTGRFSPQRRFDYRRLVTVFDSYVQTGRVDLAVRGPGGGGPRPRRAAFARAGAGVHVPRAATSVRWMPPGRPRWDGAVWHRPPARPMEGWRVATWCSWKDAVSQCWTARMGAGSWRFWTPCRIAGTSAR